MAILKSNSKQFKYNLKNSYKKNGFCAYRYFFTAKNLKSLAEDPFFIELLIENPLISPNKIVSTQSSAHIKINEEDLQSALVGNTIDDPTNENTLPSFIAVRVCRYGKERKQINAFYPAEKLVSDKKRFCLSISDNLFSEDTLSGSITCSKQDSVRFPEYNTSSGSVQWNIHYEKLIDFPVVSDKKDFFFHPAGVKCSFSGRIVFDSEEYVVSPQNCWGYCEKLWGKNINMPFFHLSSNKITNTITNKRLTNSSFTICGTFNQKIAILCNIEGEEYNFSSNGKYTKYDAVFDCTSVPQEEQDEKLHWTVSLSNNIFVCDVDIFSSALEMLVKDYEVTTGEKKVSKILSGYNGSGEVKIYKKNSKSIELIHYLKVENCLNEFGRLE